MGRCVVEHNRCYLPISNGWSGLKLIKFFCQQQQANSMLGVAYMSHIAYGSLEEEESFTYLIEVCQRWSAHYWDQERLDSLVLPNIHRGINTMLAYSYKKPMIASMHHVILYVWSYKWHVNVGCENMKVKRSLQIKQAMSNLNWNICK